MVGQQAWNAWTTVWEEEKSQWRKIISLIIVLITSSELLCELRFLFESVYVPVALAYNNNRECIQAEYGIKFY